MIRKLVFIHFIMTLFSRIGILGRKQHPELIDTLHNLITFLQKRGIALFLEADTAQLLALTTFPIYSAQELGHHCDLFIVVGGDGSLLNVARFATETNTPVVGINRGRLGFLTDIHPDELTTKLDAVLNGDYQEEQRLLLEAHFETATGQSYRDSALNEILIEAGPTTNMLEFATYIDEQFVCSQRADGIIISTPTGSTAYALSANGPIIHPQLDAVALVPMLSHTLSSRPLVIDSQCSIQISVAPDHPTPGLVSYDGRPRLELPPGKTVHITAKQQKLRLIHPVDYNYFDTLRSKLHWEKKYT